MKHSAFVLLAALLLIATAFAQTPTGGIEGTVLDQTGAVIPAARVTVTEVATARAIPLMTNAAGRFSVRNLLSGAYTVVVEASGFSTKKIGGIEVSTGQVVTIDATLQIGKAGTIVEVAAMAVNVDTARQTVDTVITANEIRQMPLFGRNFLDLAALAPGTTIRDGEAIDPTKATAYRTVGIAGRSGTGTRVQVDGIDVTDETVGTTVANFSDESVQEFQLTRSSLDPSTSLTSSGAVNIISKSGSNAIHGTWFWDYYNQDMGARLDYQPKGEPFKRNRTGGSVGGPFIKDKLFWFANWERTYQDEQKLYTSPEFPFLNQAQAFPIGIRYVDTRVDWNLTPSVRAFGKFHHDWNVTTGGSAVSPFQNLDWTNITSFGLDITRSRMTHSIRFGYVNFNNNITSQELQFPFLRVSGIPIQVNIGNDSYGPNSLAPQATYQDNYQTSYEGSLVKGRHTFRYGVDFRHFIQGGFANFAGPSTIYGVYDAGAIEAVQAAGLDTQDPLNYPFNGFQVGPANGFFTLRPSHNLPHGGKIWNREGLFLQDSLKLGRSLTLNVGVRYQYDSGYFSNDRSVKRDPILDRWGAGFSQFPDAPDYMWSPSFGFAWNPKADGKTVIRGGFYRAYEMNIINNTMFDEFSMLPAGLGPDYYYENYVAGPDGTPINADGNHPGGDYSELYNGTVGQALPMLAAVQAALNNSYANYKFDPNSGTSAFVNAVGVTYGGTIPGNQFKVPYSLQFNLGFQRELKPGTVLAVDYVFNHGVGLPFMLRDFELRRDASTLNVAAAQSKINGVLKGLTVDQYLAAHPTTTISKFALSNNDTVFQGLYPDIQRARLFQGGFTKYSALQVSLRGGEHKLGFVRDAGYNVSYALGRSLSTAAADRAEFLVTPYDNHDMNAKADFGPTGLDYTHMLRVAASFTVPGGFRVASFWTFRTAAPGTLIVSNLGGPVSGSAGYFGTDLNGDGGTGTSPRSDVLPGLTAGEWGRNVKSFDDLNKIITNFNTNYAGKLTPHGQALVAAGLFTEAQLIQMGAYVHALPQIPAGTPNPFHNMLLSDVRLERPIHLNRFREGMVVSPFIDAYNWFNHAPSAYYGGLAGRFGSYNFDYANAPEGEKASDLAYGSGRLNATRKIMIGVRFEF